jgi:hypothetical protein
MSPLNRRRFLQTSAVGTAALASACADQGVDRQLSFTTLAAALQEASRLAGATSLESSAQWSLGATLVHCAQSIEFSMQGFPQPKPAWFQHTLGAGAYQVFAWRGRMTHDLAEPIPGAPAIQDAVPAAEALARLQQAAAAFLAWQGPLKPHFAYGLLDASAYEQAHAMHVANHLSHFNAQA